MSRLKLSAVPQGIAVVALTALVCLAACNEQELRVLSPEFVINWPEEDGFVEDDLDASQLLFGTVTSGTSSAISVRIANPGSADLDLCGIYLASVVFDENGDLASEIRLDAEVANNPEIQLGFPGDSEEGEGGERLLNSGAALDFEVRYAPTQAVELPSELHLVVKHELNWDCIDDVGEGLFIPVSGLGDGNPIPDIYSLPESVEFADIDVGQISAIHEVVIGNAGPGPLEVGDVTVSDPSNFLLDAGLVPGIALAPGETETLAIQFSPQAQGNISGEISVASNDPDDNPLLIPLYGISNAIGQGKNPTAICGPDIISAPFATEQLDGSGSVPEPLTYQWALTTPPGSTAVLDSYTIATPSITLDLAGTYTGELTVTNPAGDTDSCTQNIEAIPNENFRIEMYWANSGDDMDLHLLEANDGSGNSGLPRDSDSDCYYASCVTNSWGGTPPDWGVAGVADDDPALDLDDISGVGPENINITSPALSPYDGDYVIFVHDYPGSVFEAANDVTVNVYLNGVLTQSFNFQHVGEDDDYYVAKINWPTGVITPCNGVATSPSAGCP